MSKDNPYEMVRAFITEQMTVNEISAMNDAIECYLNGAVFDSDHVIATKIRKKFWKSVWGFREASEDYYRRARDDAEQDY